MFTRIHFESAERPCGFCVKLSTGQWHEIDHCGISRCLPKAPGYVFKHSQCMEAQQISDDPELRDLGYERLSFAPTAATSSTDVITDVSTLLDKARDLHQWDLYRVTVDGGSVVTYEYVCDIAHDAGNDAE